MGDHDRKDSRGRLLVVGVIVRVDKIPDDLLRGLPDEDQKAITECVGSMLPIAGFNDENEAELEFVDGYATVHTIWIDTNCLSLC